LGGGEILLGVWAGPIGVREMGACQRIAVGEILQGVWVAQLGAGGGG
jgi:hypothetical protein